MCGIYEILYKFILLDIMEIAEIPIRASTGIRNLKKENPTGMMTGISKN